MIEINRKLSELVKTKRGNTGLRTTAKVIGISSSTLSRIERGHMSSIESLHRILQWLDLDEETMKSNLTCTVPPPSPKERTNYIISLARKLITPNGSNESDISIDIGETQISEGSDNGAWVRAWVWVDFTDTVLDKET